MSITGIHKNAYIYVNSCKTKSCREQACLFPTGYFFFLREVFLAFFSFLHGPHGIIKSPNVKDETIL